MKGIACVILILGLLKFAQDAPDLFKTIFAFGGDLLKGMNLDPRGQLRNDFATASKPIGKVAGGLAGAAGGLAAGAARGFRQAGADYNAAHHGSKHLPGRILHTAGATLAGGARGLVRGGRTGFTNSDGSLMPGNMYSQLMGGADQGNIAAQMNSQNYREGDSTFIGGRIVRRIGNGFIEFGSDHVVDPARDFIGNVSGRNTASEAAQMFATAKANNTAAMTATGTDIAMGELKTARDDALGNIREARASGTDINELMEELHIAANKRQGINNYDDLIKMVKNDFTSQKRNTLNKKFENMNDENKRIIAEYNKQTLDNFEENVSLLGEADLKDLLNNIKLKDANGNDIAGANLSANASSADIQRALSNMMSRLRQSADVNHLTNTEGGSLMLNMDALQTQLKNTNDTIEHRKALQEHNKANRNRSAASGSDSSSSSSSGGGAS
jgi:hypothetical protein